jgi:hypothetical protein
MNPRLQWAQDFIAWIEMPHAVDEAEMRPLPEPEHTDVEDNSSSGSD